MDALQMEVHALKRLQTMKHLHAGGRIFSDNFRQEIRKME